VSVDQKYKLGIVELDSQHEEIEKCLIELRTAIETKDRWHVLHYHLESLLEKLVFHFSFEEAVMQIFSYPEAENHARSHQALLEAVQHYKNQNLTSAEAEHAGPPPLELFHEQILTHDLHFSAYIKGLKERLGID
jgi:hemerythrin-like metal-binding protein